MQRALLQYYKPENRKIVTKALRLAGRTDLIGTGSGCLVAPDIRRIAYSRNSQQRGLNYEKRVNAAKFTAKGKKADGKKKK